MKPCSFCIEETCKGKFNCDCENCKQKETCNKHLWPTIRITTKCTQKCSHCCFECSPEKSDMMSVEMAENISSFLDNHEIEPITLMGGECFCNPNWKKIFDILIPKRDYVRIVSNGDFSLDETNGEFLTKYPNIKIAISNDKWHTNKNIQRCVDLCEKFGIRYDVATEEKTTADSIVPIGRAIFDYSVYSSFSCFCHNPSYKYHFFIDETGEIFKCGFGVWNYSNINEASFFKRFKEFNQKFYSVFIPNCGSCIRGFKKSNF